MTAEEFALYIEPGAEYRDKGKARLNRIRAAYALYVEAYSASLVSLCYMAHNRGSFWAVRKAAEDRDAGRPMALVTELL